MTDIVLTGHCDGAGQFDCNTVGHCDGAGQSDCKTVDHLEASQLEIEDL